VLPQVNIHITSDEAALLCAKYKHDDFPELVNYVAFRWVLPVGVHTVQECFAACTASSSEDEGYCASSLVECRGSIKQQPLALLGSRHADAANRS
jgi:hypothetical protein